MKTRKTWGVVNRATDKLTVLVNPTNDLGYFETPAIFKSRRLAYNYIRLGSLYVPDLAKMVRVERIVITGAK